MKKIILILLIATFSSVCFAKEQLLLQPKEIDNLWYVWADYNGINSEILIDHWDGSNWSQPYKITDNSMNALSPSVVLDNKNNPWVVWTGHDGISTSIYCRYYDGRSWSQTRQVDDVDIYWDSNPVITIDKKNTPWVTWVGSDGKDDDIYVSYWNGKNWAQPTMVNSDDFTPDVMPVIFTDRENNLFIAWCSFDVDRYKLFYSIKLNNKWSEEKPLVQNLIRAGADHPNILKKSNGEIELIWIEENLGYKSHWNASSWSDPESIEILLPKDFFQAISVGSSYVSWVQDSICQSFRIMPPIQKAQKIISTYLRHNSTEYLSWFSNLLCPTANAEVEENKYIAFGDSITTGYGDSWDISPGVPAGYPFRLEQKLNEKIAPSIVVNEGNPGEYTPSGLERIDGVLNKHNAKFILIMEGANDTTAAFSTETIIFDLGTMVDHSKEFGTTPLLASLTPRMDFMDERVRDDINPSIQQLASEKGVTFVDQYTEFAKDKALYMADGRLHPNSAGYQLIAETWFMAIDNILNPDSDKDEDSGCGVVPPIYRNGRNNGILNNLLPLAVLTILLFFWRRLRYNLSN